MTLRSWSEEELLAAFKAGKKIYKLDTGTSGKDDVLVGDTYREVLQDVLDNEEVIELPEGWSLDEIGEGDEPLYSLIGMNKGGL